MNDIILASASPQRVNLLQNLGLSFKQVISEISEENFFLDNNNPPERIVEDLAFLKAEDVAKKEKKGVIIAADTVVVLDKAILGKPTNDSDAVCKLRMLSGKTHVVISGVAVINTDTGVEISGYEKTDVLFKNLTDKEIYNYVITGEPRDKAGGYGIQGIGALLVKSIRGCYNNVVGLPLVKLTELLKESDFDLWDAVARRS